MSGLIRGQSLLFYWELRERIIVMPVIGLIILENIEEDKRLVS